MAVKGGVIPMMKQIAMGGRQVPVLLQYDRLGPGTDGLLAIYLAPDESCWVEKANSLYVRSSFACAKLRSLDGGSAMSQGDIDAVRTTIGWPS